MKGQLARYFNASPSVSLAILTNGLEYRFFTDTGDPNVMDTRPFYVWRVDSVDSGIEVVARFQKSLFSAGAIREYATELIYTARIVDFLRGELDLRERDPGDSFVRWVLGGERIYEGRLTASVVERFSPIIKNALQSVLRDVVRRSLVALDQAVSPPVDPEEATPTPSVPAESGDTGPSKVQTTERVLACLEVVNRIFMNSRYSGATIYEPSVRKDVPVELGFKDTTGYFGIYLNKPGWWCLRIVADAKQPWVAFNIPTSNGLPVPTGFRCLDPHPFGDFRLTFSTPQDFDTLSPFVMAAFAQTIKERKALAQSVAAT